MTRVRRMMQDRDEKTGHKLLTHNFVWETMSIDDVQAIAVHVHPFSTDNHTPLRTLPLSLSLRQLPPRCHSSLGNKYLATSAFRKSRQRHNQKQGGASASLWCSWFLLRSTIDKFAAGSQCKDNQVSKQLLECITLSKKRQSGKHAHHNHSMILMSYLRDSSITLLQHGLQFPQLLPCFSASILTWCPVQRVHEWNLC